MIQCDVCRKYKEKRVGYFVDHETRIEKECRICKEINRSICDSRKMEELSPMSEEVKGWADPDSRFHRENPNSLKEEYIDMRLKLHYITLRSR